MKSGTLFQYRRYSIHDGPGIRTTVFLKGCRLSCSWCHNPEGIPAGPQLAVNPERCSGCAICAGVCPAGAIPFDSPSETDRALCTACGRCADACPAGAREVAGFGATSGEVMKAIERDIPFYSESGGGVTFSGGEPLMQWDFLEELLLLCRNRGIHTAVDTSCHASSEVFDRIASVTDIMLCDIKLADCGDMLRYTGVSGELILENILRLARNGGNFILRMPVIPGITDTARNITGIAVFLRSLPEMPEFVLLPYHSSWTDKYRRFGMALTAAPPAGSEESLDQALRGFEDAGIQCGRET